MEFEELMDKLKKLSEEVEENLSEDALNFRIVTRRLVDIAKLLLNGKQEDEIRGFFLLGCLITEMENILENQEQEDEE